MSTKVKLLRNRSTLFALCPMMVLFLVVIATLNGCNRVSDEQLAQAVETAMKRSTLRHKADILKNLQANAQKLAVQELERLNKAEQVYDTQVFFNMIGSFHPMGYGFWFKIKRGLSSYEIVDIRESDSLFHKYEVLIEYEYDVLRTHRFASAYEGSYEKADKDFNFQKIGEEGSWEFLYRFDADFEWDGEDAEFVRAKGYQVPLYSLGARTPATRQTEYKATKRATPSSLGRQRSKRSTSSSKKAPDTKGSPDKGVSQKPKESPAGTP